MPIKRRYLYHVTDPENVESILRDGLLRGGGKRQSSMVYLSEKPLSWWSPGMKILKVDIKNLMGEWSDFLSESDEVLFWGDIPAERIKAYEPKVKKVEITDLKRFFKLGNGERGTGNGRVRPSPRRAHGRALMGRTTLPR